MKHLPNTLTLANLFSGCCALVFLFNGLPDLAAYCTGCCFLFDYLDGMAARALKISSPLGKELDSLADVISFGVVPGAMLYHMCNPRTDFIGDVGTGVAINFLAFPTFVLSAFAALRLAKFNLDTRQGNYFLGLSTPACTVFVLGLTLGVWNNRFGMADLLVGNWPVLYTLIGLLSWLMLSEVPMFGMKIKGFGNSGNWLILSFLGLFAVLFVFLKELAFSAIIVVYVLSSVLFKERITMKE